MKPLSEYGYNVRPRTSENLLLLISELEGSYQNLRYMGFEEDMYLLEEMKKKYHKLYFKTERGDA